MYEDLSNQIRKTGISNDSATEKKIMFTLEFKSF